MKSKQQKQTKEFFDSEAEHWFKKAKKKSNHVNVIKQRNSFVEDLALKFLPKKSRILDVGCGTGDLVITLRKKGFQSFGIDFANSMILKAKKEANKANIDDVIFKTVSYFDFDSSKKFDLIAANGFIEYISEKEYLKFLKISHKLLKKGGFLVFGSRNRLFNVFSFNDYTNDEIKNNTIIDLVKECIFFNNSKSFNDLKNKQPKRLQNLKKHPFTGIGVDVRYQYTPLQIMSSLQRNNFKVIDLSPVHVHLFSTGAMKKEKNIHDYLSNKIQFKNNIKLQLIPQSSTFMIAAKK